MALFSERYGYKKVSDVIIREKITPEIKNAICTCFDKLNNIFELAGYRFGQNVRIELEKHIWTFFSISAWLILNIQVQLLPTTLKNRIQNGIAF